jgi:hypothetical protein
VAKWPMDLVDPLMYRFWQTLYIIQLARIEGVSGTCLGACVRVESLLSSALVGLDWTCIYHTL